MTLMLMAKYLLSTDSFDLLAVLRPTFCKDFSKKKKSISWELMLPQDGRSQGPSPGSVAPTLHSAVVCEQFQGGCGAEAGTAEGSAICKQPILSKGEVWAMCPVPCTFLFSGCWLCDFKACLFTSGFVHVKFFIHHDFPWVISLPFLAQDYFSNEIDF